MSRPPVLATAQINLLGLRTPPNSNGKVRQYAAASSAAVSLGSV